MATLDPEESIKAFLAQTIEERGEEGDIIGPATEIFGVSRQTIHKYLADMIAEGILEATGRTRGRVYTLKPLVGLERFFDLHETPGEDVIWRNFFAEPMAIMPENIRGICTHGFTEMVNNAIEHSDGQVLRVGMRRTYASVRLWVGDDGVGIFKKIKEGLKLADEREAILELATGKTTTDPGRHSGEGIFFTSRMFERFTLKADKLTLVHLSPEDEDDWLIQDSKPSEPSEPLPGTFVRMRISSWSQRTAAQVFEKYTSRDSLGFARTHVPLRLLLVGEENLISRSQAKRVLARFLKFKEVILDFDGITQIGQGFADEIFRVFATEHPDIALYPLRTNDQVERMIKHVQQKE